MLFPETGRSAGLTNGSSAWQLGSIDQHWSALIPVWGESQGFLWPTLDVFLPLQPCLLVRNIIGYAHHYHILFSEHLLYARQQTRWFIYIVSLISTRVLWGRNYFATLLRFRHIKGLTQSHTPSKWESWDFNSSLPGFNACLLSAPLLLLGICVSLGWKKSLTIMCNWTQRLLTSSHGLHSPHWKPSVWDALWSCFTRAPGTRKVVQKRFGANNSPSTWPVQICRWSWSANWQSTEWGVGHAACWLSMETITVFSPRPLHSLDFGWLTQ